MTTVLVVSAHPDDETLGCGGTLLRHRAAGDEVHWLIATRPRPPAWKEADISRKDEEVRKVAASYGMAKVHRLDFAAAGLEREPFPALMEGVRKAVEDCRPDTVYAVHPGDVHADHRTLFQALAAVLKPFRMKSLGVRRLLCFETLSSTDAAPPTASAPFVPTVFKDISAFLERKLEVLELYASELQPAPGPRSGSSVRALARLRGATVGVDAAEAFALVREAD